MKSILAIAPRCASFPPTAARELLLVALANRLEALTGDRKGQHGIRINDQWRVCFLWQDGDAHSVEIVDYH